MGYGIVFYFRFCVQISHQVQDMEIALLVRLYVHSQFLVN